MSEKIEIRTDFGRNEEDGFAGPVLLEFIRVEPGFGQSWRVIFTIQRKLIPKPDQPNPPGGFWSRESTCARVIDRNGNKPTGKEFLATASKIVGRELTKHEESQLLSIKIVGR